LTESGRIEFPQIDIEDGIVTAIEPGTPSDATGTLTVASLDIHVHGAVNQDFMSADAAGIAAVGGFLAQRGVAFYLPTTVTGPIDPTLRALERLATAIEAGPAQAAATAVGIHLEGPFISHLKRGVHPTASIQAPSVALFERMQQAARGHIRLITLAPELPHALELIHHATAAGVRISLGHSNATAAETRAAIAAGAASATHLFNAMRPLDHREPGIAATILDSDSVYAEAICDGVHLDPAIVRLWLKMKGETRAILVTDGISATGMPEGTYQLGDFPVEVRGGVCTLLGSGTLAGSTLTMDAAIANVQRFTGISLAGATRLASRNPAAMLGLPQLGRVGVGSPANFNLYDDAGKLTATMLRGERIA
jgi:N-acetylglucosamine-6-phosphate deacetylase